MLISMNTLPRNHGLPVVLLCALVLMAPACDKNNESGIDQAGENDALSNDGLGADADAVFGPDSADSVGLDDTSDASGETDGVDGQGLDSLGDTFDLTDTNVNDNTVPEDSSSDGSYFEVNDSTWETLYDSLDANPQDVPTDSSDLADSLDVNDTEVLDITDVADGQSDSSDTADGSGDTSADSDTSDPCDNIELWLDKYGGNPTCPGYDVDENWDANYCEFYLNALGDGYEGHYGIPFRWLEAYISVGSNNGVVLNAGMYTIYTNDGVEYVRYSMGTQIEPDYWKTGFTYQYTGYMGEGSYYYEVKKFAFFIDVQRPNGTITRLWQSNFGQNYSWDDAFLLPATETSIPYGSVDYSNDNSVIFGTKKGCLQ